MDVPAAVVIPAAGAGRRLGGRSKALVSLAGQPILQRTLAPFLGEPRIRQIVVAVDAATRASPPDWLAQCDERVSLVTGGAERGDSVYAALRVVMAAVDVVLVHDAARPLVSAALVRRTLDAAAQGGSVVAALPVTDTLHAVDDDHLIVGTPDRAHLWHAQTPQAFPRDLLMAAYEWAATRRVRATDDASLVVQYGAPVRVIEGEPINLKITTELDLTLAEVLLAAR